MIRDISMVEQWLDGRKRLLELIDPKIASDPTVRLLVSRCRTADRILHKKISERVLGTESGKK